jgi:hypothetical protein
MKITEEQFERIKHCFPGQRGNVKMSNLEFLNAILHVAENGCKRRGLPREFGNRHTVYRRMSRRSKSGVLHPVFTGLQVLQTVKVKVEHVSLDSTGIKVHPDAAGVVKNSGRNPSDSLAVAETPRFIRLPQMTGQHQDLYFPPVTVMTHHADGSC